jgi:hypothetical protein
MKNWLTLGILLLTPVGASSAADQSLITDSASTLETEIKRGVQAESACSAIADAEDYAHCIFAVEARNQQKVVDYKPFDTGLFFKAWITLDLLGNPGGPADTRSASPAAAAARQQAASLYTVFRADQRKVGATDELMIAASGMPSSILESRLAVWASQPPQ